MNQPLMTDSGLLDSEIDASEILEQEVNAILTGM
jgi:hypothetical protein